jgi:hypothetical protein
MGLPDKAKVMHTDEDEVESVPNTYPIKLNIQHTSQSARDRGPQHLPPRDNDPHHLSPRDKDHHQMGTDYLNLEATLKEKRAAGRVVDGTKKKGKQAWKRLAREKGRVVEAGGESKHGEVMQREDLFSFPAKRPKLMDGSCTLEESISAEAVDQPRRHQ